MTTLIYDGRGDKHLLVADSLVSGGVPLGTEKLVQVRKTIIGICGDLEPALVFVDWFKNKRKSKPSFKDEADFEAIVVSAGKAEWWGPAMRAIPINEPYYAVGSGSEYAIGALDAGANALKAMEIAIARDSSTGGRVKTLSLTKAKR